jgi:hypothetical protein
MAEIILKVITVDPNIELTMDKDIVIVITILNKTIRKEDRNLSMI